jgi:hypothetical protein
MTKSAVQMRGPVKIKAKSPVVSGRVHESLHRQIRQAAKKSGRTMSEEMAVRLGQSFGEEETFGGPEMRRMTMLLGVAFLQGAQQGQYMHHGTPINAPLDQRELTNPASGTYREGALAVVQSLMVGMPEDNKALFLMSLESRVVSDFMNKRRLANGELS